MSRWADPIRSIATSTRTRVGPATSSRVETRDGVSWRGVFQNPLDLAKAAGLERDVYAIARCVRSEVGDDNPAACLAIAGTLYNAAARKSIRPYHYCVGLTSSAYAWTQWHFGEQHGRRVSTRQDPTGRTVAAAQLGDDARDFVGGAVVWYNPRVQDSGAQGTRKLAYDAEGIAAKWGAEGLEWIGPLPGIDTYREAAFLRPVKGRANQEALASVIELGRAGRPTLGTDSPDPRVAQVAASGLPWFVLAAGAVAIL